MATKDFITTLPLGLASKFFSFIQKYESRHNYAQLAAIVLSGELAQTFDQVGPIHDQAGSDCVLSTAVWEAV